MNKIEIVLGGVYTNGKGRIRKVIDFGEQYKLYDGQECKENLQYEIINDGTKDNRTAGERHNMTVQGFSQWAKKKVSL